MFSAADLLAGCGDGVVDDQVCLYRVFGKTPACQRTLSVSYISMEDILSCVLLNIILFTSCICDRARVCFMSCNKAFSTTLSCGEIDRILWTENNKIGHRYDHISATVINLILVRNYSQFHLSRNSPITKIWRVPSWDAHPFTIVQLSLHFYKIYI